MFLCIMSSESEVLGNAMSPISERMDSFASVGAIRDEDFPSFSLCEPIRFADSVVE